MTELEKIGEYNYRLTTDAMSVTLNVGELVALHSEVMDDLLGNAGHAYTTITIKKRIPKAEAGELYAILRDVTGSGKPK